MFYIIIFIIKINQKFIEIYIFRKTWIKPRLDAPLGTIRQSHQTNYFHNGACTIRLKKKKLSIYTTILPKGKLE